MRKPKTHCIHCGVKLTSENFTHHMTKLPKRWFVCNDCFKKCVYKSIRKYYNKHKISKKTNCYNRLKAYRSFALNIINYTCQECNQKSDRMELHHLDGDFHNNNAENLMFLCFACHRKKSRKHGKYVIPKDDTVATEL